MKVLITGAGSGIGLEIAKIYQRKGYDLILVSRNIENLKNLFPKAEILSLDLSVKENCFELHTLYSDVDILINNAGFGDWGNFWETDINKGLNMIDLNINGVYTLTKLYIKDMVNKNSGTILNVASLAAYSYGPLMSNYYATKAYVYKLSTSINYELKKANKNVKVLCLCPGPVDTGFNKRAGVNFSVKPLDAKYVAKVAVRGIEKGKKIILPGFGAKFSAIGSRFMPIGVLLKIGYWIQKNK
ncbi:MAG: SDR family NAD(P)-dependent oxidoreductase [Lachnospirales bacterium]